MYFLKEFFLNNCEIVEDATLSFFSLSVDLSIYQLITNFKFKIFNFISRYAKTDKFYYKFTLLYS